MIDSERYIDDRKLQKIELTDLKSEKKRASELVRFVRSVQAEYDAARRVREDTWLESWASYLGTPQSNRWVRQRIAEVVGNVQSDWRHQLTTSKSFEIVETINSWLQGAFFPNHNWFDLLPRMHVGDPEWKKFLRMMKKYMNKKLDDAMFQAHWDANMRQAIILGTSCICLPWRYETRDYYKNHVIQHPAYGEVVSPMKTSKVIKNCPELEVLDMFDVWLDPSAHDSNSANMVRRLLKTKGEILQLIDQGVYKADKKKIMEMKPKEEVGGVRRHEIDNFLGISNNVGYWSPTDIIEIWEFWGDIYLSDVEYKDVVVAVCGDELLALEANPFWDGKPFVFTTYIPVLNSPYGISALDPVLGNIHEMNIIMNQRLDGGELAINPMWEALNDGTVDLEQIFTEPGRIIPVAQSGALRPIPRDTDFQYSISEEALLATKIERATGVTIFIGAGGDVGRRDRVTLGEVQAQKEAGGNRLNGIHRHVENTALLPFLKRMYAYMQQFVTAPEVVRVRGEDPGSWEYLEVGVHQLSIDMDVIPLGADHIANREYELKNRLDFIRTVAEIPQMAQQLNWTEILIDLASRFLEEDYERFINGQAPQTNGTSLPDPNTAPQSPDAQAAAQEQLNSNVPVDMGNGAVAPVAPDQLQQLQEAAKFSQGNPGVGALQSQMMAQPVSDTLSQLKTALGI